MKNSEVLRKARTLIEWGEQSYVCLAVTISGSSSMQIKRLRAWIHDLLEGCYTLEVWLEVRRGIDPDYGLTRGQAEVKMKVTRLEWMTWMIAYWEAREQ